LLTGSFIGFGNRLSASLVKGGDSEVRFPALFMWHKGKSSVKHYHSLPAFGGLIHGYFAKGAFIMKKNIRNDGHLNKVSRFPLFFLLLISAIALSACSRSSGHKSEVVIKDYPEFTTEDASSPETKFSSVDDYLASIGITSEDTSEADAAAGSESNPAAEGESSTEGLSSDGSVPESQTKADGSASTEGSTAETTAAGTQGTDFKAYFLEVGQGDSSLIICDGHALLIDGGQSSQADTVYNFLSSRNITHLDYMVASCLDENHTGGLMGALRSASVDTVLAPVSSSDREPVQAFVNALAEQNVSITVPSAGDTYSLGSAAITVLGPVRQGNNDNNNSLVLRVVHGENSILFAGDAEQPEENDILQSGADIRSTILKVGNHGSSSSTGSDWLKAIAPTAAVISCGSDNEFGHPSAAVLDNLKNNNVKVYRTDLQGFLKVTEENGKFEYRIARNASIDVFIPGATLVIRPDGSGQ
jgi:competence protein ComEC